MSPQFRGHTNESYQKVASDNIERTEFRLTTMRFNDIIRHIPIHQFIKKMHYIKYWVRFLWKKTIKEERSCRGAASVNVTVVGQITNRQNEFLSFFSSGNKTKSSAQLHHPICNVILFCLSTSLLLDIVLFSG